MKQRRGLTLGAVLGIASLATAACGGTVETSKSKAGGTSNIPNARAIKSAPGFDPSAGTMNLGVITALTGPVAVIGKPITAGMETYFKALNAKGGIAGKYQVKLDEEDSQYNSQLAVQGYNKIKDNDVLIAQLLGTASTKAVLPLLQQDGVVASPASSDADWVHDPNLLPTGAPYQVQMINGADYAVNGLGLKSKTFCSLIQDDSYGKAGQAGIDFASGLLGFATKVTAKYAVGTGDLTAQVQLLKSSGCEVTFLVATPDITAAAFSKASALSFAPQWIGTSPTYLSALVASPLKDYMAAHYLVVSEGPQWGDRSSPGGAALQDALTKFSPGQQPDYYFSFGYYQGWEVAQILEKAVSLGDLGRAGILNAMAKAGTLSFAGLSGDYHFGSASDRDPPRESSIFKVVPATPGGLQVVKASFTSDEARAFSNFKAIP